MFILSRLIFVSEITFWQYRLCQHWKHCKSNRCPFGLIRSLIYQRIYLQNYRKKILIAHIMKLWNSIATMRWPFNFWASFSRTKSINILLFYSTRVSKSVLSFTFCMLLCMLFLWCILTLMYAIFITCKLCFYNTNKKTQFRLNSPLEMKSCLVLALYTWMVLTAIQCFIVNECSWNGYEKNASESYRLWPERKN